MITENFRKEFNKMLEYYVEAKISNADFMFSDELVKLFSQDYQQTLEFLKQANREEISVSVGVLEKLIRVFPKQELLDVFIGWKDSFPKEGYEELFDDFCECYFHEEVEIATDILEEITQEQN